MPRVSPITVEPSYVPFEEQFAALTSAPEPRPSSPEDPKLKYGRPVVRPLSLAEGGAYLRSTAPREKRTTVDPMASRFEAPRLEADVMKSDTVGRYGPVDGCAVKIAFGNVDVLQPLHGPIERLPMNAEDIVEVVADPVMHGIDDYRRARARLGETPAGAALLTRFEDYPPRKSLVVGEHVVRNVVEGAADARDPLRARLAWNPLRPALGDDQERPGAVQLAMMIAKALHRLHAPPEVREQFATSRDEVPLEETALVEEVLAPIAGLELPPDPVMRERRLRSVAHLHRATPPIVDPEVDETTLKRYLLGSELATYGKALLLTAAMDAFEPRVAPVLGHVRGSVRRRDAKTLVAADFVRYELGVMRLNSLQLKALLPRALATNVVSRVHQPERLEAIMRTLEALESSRQKIASVIEATSGIRIELDSRDETML